MHVFKSHFRDANKLFNAASTAFQSQNFVQAYQQFLVLSELSPHMLEVRLCIISASDH